MSFFHWLATGSSNGILLEQEKEPALSKPFLPFYSAATLQSQSFDPGCSADGPIGKEDLCRVARLAHIIDERDGNLLADKSNTVPRRRFRSSVRMPSTMNPMFPAKSALCCTAAVRWSRL